MLTRASHGLLNNGRWILGPNERCRVVVPVLNVVLNVSDKSLNCVKGATANGFARKNTEPSFNHIQPGSAGRCEMKVDSWVSFQPRQHGRSLVGGRVVQNHVQISSLVATVEHLKKSEKIG